MTIRIISINVQKGCGWTYVLGREHQVVVVLEARVDVVGVAVAGDGTWDNALKKTNHLNHPWSGRRGFFCAMTGASLPGVRPMVFEDVVPEVCLVLLVGVGARAETPNSQRAVQKRYTRVNALEHTVRG